MVDPSMTHGSEIYINGRPMGDPWVTNGRSIIGQLYIPMGSPWATHVSSVGHPCMGLSWVYSGSFMVRL